jgi:predicted enzyme related to lactoylglutathione lyase
MEASMLTNAKVGATIPAVDLARARKFYESKLGLKVLAEDPSPGIQFQAGAGTGLYVYQRAATKADHTVASFTVQDVQSEVQELKSKGVKFLDVETPTLKTTDSIATMETPAGNVKIAWFYDTEGNILAVSNM